MRRPSKSDDSDRSSSHSVGDAERTALTSSPTRSALRRREQSVAATGLASQRYVILALVAALIGTLGWILVPSRTPPTSRDATPSTNQMDSRLMDTSGESSPSARTAATPLVPPMSMECCPPDSWPALNTSTSSTGGASSHLGREVDLGDGVVAYVVVPPDSQSKPPTVGLISFQDIYRYDTDRCKGVMDQFAVSAGYIVVHVDFLGTNVFVSGHNDLMAWVKDRPFDTFIKPKLVHTIIPYLQKEHHVTTILAMGFCWGSYMALQAMADADVQAHFAASVHFHPSLGLNAAFDPDDAECVAVARRVTAPTLLIPAGNDPAFLGPDGTVVAALLNPHSQSVVMTDMKHGFSIRGDVSDPLVRRDVQAALTRAMDFFRRSTP